VYRWAQIEVFARARTERLAQLASCRPAAPPSCRIGTFTREGCGVRITCSRAGYQTVTTSGCRILRLRIGSTGAAATAARPALHTKHDCARRVSRSQQHTGQAAPPPRGPARPSSWRPRGHPWPKRVRVASFCTKRRELKPGQARRARAVAVAAPGRSGGQPTRVYRRAQIEVIARARIDA
jgi:hypothetical protein